MYRGTVKTFNPSKYRIIESQLGKDAHVYPNGDCYFYLVDNRDKDFHDHLSGMCNRLAFLCTSLLPEILQEGETATLYIKYKEGSTLISKGGEIGYTAIYPDSTYAKATGFRFERYKIHLWEIRHQLNQIKNYIKDASSVIAHCVWDERLKQHRSRVTGYRWLDKNGNICVGTEPLSFYLLRRSNETDK